MPIAQLSQITMAYEQDGQGQPLLMIMGIGAQLIQWPSAFCDALKAQGFALIKADNRDCGLSSKLIENGVPNIRKNMLKRLVGIPIEAPYSLEDMANDFVELLDHLGIESCHVLGISMGSMIAQIIAGSHPARVRSLTLMYSNTGKRRHSLVKPAAMRRLMIRGKTQNKSEYMEGFVQLFETIGSPQYRRSREELLQFAAEAYDRSHHSPGFTRQLLAVFATGDRERFYRKITCPTAIIHGHLDPLMPLSGAQMLAKSISHSTSHFFTDLGHDLPDHYINNFVTIIKDKADESHH